MAEIYEYAVGTQGGLTQRSPFGGRVVPFAVVCGFTVHLSRLTALQGLRLRTKFRSDINAFRGVTPCAVKKPLAPSGKSVALSRASCPTERGVSRSSRALEQDAMDANGVR
jgi:hypothetical protein